MSKNLLEKELAAYAQQKDRLVAESSGKYALVSDDEVLGVWDTYEDALQAGYSTVGLKPFLVKEIQPVETAQFIGRAFSPCPS